MSLNILKRTEKTGDVPTGAEGFIYSTLSRQSEDEALRCVRGPQGSSDVVLFEGC